MIEVIDFEPDHIECQEHERFIYLYDSTYHHNRGIACIVASPKRHRAKNKLIVLVHGSLSHKNAIYQPLLAHCLAELGYHSLRLDFRGLGDSEDVRDPKLGRTIEEDIHDIKTVYKATQEAQICANLFETESITFHAIVGHSRGVLAMFDFALSIAPSIIPILVNCSGRFDGQGLLKRCSENNPNWIEKGGFYATTLRQGKLQKIWIPKEESFSVIRTNTLNYRNLSHDTTVISIYGTNDEVVPPMEASLDYASVFKDHHQLIYIDGAGHNFYGKLGEQNTRGLPLRRGMINYNHELVEYLQDIFTKSV